MTPRRRHSAKAWAARLGLAAGFLVLGVSSTRHALGMAVRGADPERALAINPSDARLMAVAAQRRAQAIAQAQNAGTSADRGSPADLRRLADLASRALVRDPMSLPAVDALAMVSLFEGREQRGRDLFGYAAQLSRRDLSAQLWLIEDAVARGEVGNALLHHDIALRTSAAAPDLLFPVLASAIVDPAVRRALADRMAAQRPFWTEAFLSHAADKGPDFVAVAKLFAELPRRGVPVAGYARAALIGRLVERRQYDVAWRYYASGSPDADRRRSRDPAFAAMPADPTVFDWAVLNDAGTAASIQGNRADDGVLSFSAAPALGGPLARQMQILPPGRYAIQGTSADIDQPQESWPYWSLTCLDGREIATVPVPASARDGGRFGGTMVVPAGCPVQWLTLIARQGDGTQALQGAIRTVTLRPAR